MIWIKFAIREIKNNKKFALFFVINLSLGLVGFSLIENFKAILENNLQQSSKQILTADLSLSARRMITSNEVELAHKILGPNEIKSLELLEFYTMIKSSSGKTRLVLIKAIDEGYPIYGQMYGSQKDPLPKIQSDLYQSNSIWIYPELKTQLKVKEGDFVWVGKEKFKITQEITKDTGDMWASASMAPRAYIHKIHVPQTQLLQKGSTYFHTWFFKLSSDEKIKELADQLHSQIKDPAIRVWTPHSASEQLGRLMNYLNDYLSLTSLVAFFLSSIGAGFLYRGFLIKRLKDIAILNSLGAQKTQAQRIYILQIFILGVLAAITSVLVAQLLFPWLLKLSQDLVPLTLKSHFNWQTFLTSLFLATLGSLLICFPLLNKVKTLQTHQLFNEHQSPTIQWNLQSWLLYIPALLIYWLIAIWQSHSIKVGSLFTLVFLGSITLLIAIGLFGFYLFEKIRTSHLSLKLAFRSLYKNKTSSLAAYLAISLGALLINIIPQLQKNIESEVQSPHQSRLPSLFLFDIQEEQVSPLQTLLKQEKVELNALSPLIRSRILKVNDEDFVKGLRQGQSLTREQEQEMRFRNRGFNLTYRTKISPSEEIIKGPSIDQPYNPNENTPPKISIEYRFADRLHLKLGDQILFDVQGVEVLGQVTNLRKVRWTSFQPNFFVQFQGGVLDDAPKTYLASIPKSTLISKELLQEKIVDQFPNISIIDVERVVKQILGIVDKMSWSLIFMAILCFFVGFIVLFSISHFQIMSRKWDIHLLKMLGGSHHLIQKIFAYEFFILSLIASLVGVGMSFAISYTLSQVLFDSLWVWSWQIPTLIIVLLVSLSILLALSVTHQVLRQKINFGDES